MPKIYFINQKLKIYGIGFIIMNVGPYCANGHMRKAKDVCSDAGFMFYTHTVPKKNLTLH